MAGLEETLDLDITEALDSIGKIEDALGESATNFKVALADALDLLSQPTPIEVDTDGITKDIDTAVTSADTTIDPNVDTDAVTKDIDSAISNADTTITVDADTTAAQTQIADLGDAASGADDGLSSLEGNVEGIKTASALAGGEAGALTDTLKNMGTGGQVAAGSIAAVTATTTELFHAGLDADEATARFNRTLGDQADAVDHIKIGGLNDDLSELAVKVGSSASGLKNSAASIFQLGTSAGFAGPEVAQTTSQIIALASRAVALNPALGSAGDAATRLVTGLANGGRRVSAFGLSLTSAEINARALSDTGKTTATDLSLYEKAAAGAEIATEQLGTSLGKDVNAGAQTAEVQFKSIKATFEETLETLGKPLLTPVIDGFKEAQPLFIGFARDLGEIGGALLPLASSLLPVLKGGLAGVTATTAVLVPVLDELAKIIDGIPTPVLGAIGTFLVFQKVLGPFPALFSTVNTSVRALGGWLTTNAAAAATDATALAAAGTQTELFGAESAVAGTQLSLFGGEAVVAREQLSLFGDEVAAVAGEAEASEVAVEGFSLGMDAALGPIGLVAAGVAGLVSIINAHSEAAKKEADAINKVSDAFEDNSKSVADDSEAIAKQTFDSGTLNALGLTYAQVAKDASDGAAGAARFGQALKDSDLKGFFPTALANKSFQELTKQLQGGAQAAIADKVASGDLTKAQASAAEKAQTAADGTVNYVSALKKLHIGVQEATPDLNSLAAGVNSVTGANVDFATQLAAVQTQLDSTKQPLDQANDGLAKLGLTTANDVTDALIKGGLTAADYTSIINETGLSLDDLVAKQQDLAKASETFSTQFASGIDGVETAEKDLKNDTSLDDFFKDLNDQVAASVKFSDNIQKLIGRGATGLAEAFAAQGQSAATATDQAAHLSDSQLAARETQFDKLKASDDKAHQQLVDAGTALFTQQQNNLNALSTARPPDLSGLTIAELDKLNAELARHGEQVIAPTAAQEAQRIGKSYTDGIQSGVENNAPAVKETLKLFGFDTGIAISDGASSGVASKQKGQTETFTLFGHTIGIAFGAGVQSGIGEKQKDVSSAGESLGTQLLSKVKSILGIKSPSTEGAEIGQLFNQGLVNGLSANGSVLAAANKTATALTNISPVAPAFGASASVTPVASAGAAGGGNAAVVNGPLFGSVEFHDNADPQQVFSEAQFQFVEGDLATT